MKTSFISYLPNGNLPSNHNREMLNKKVKERLGSYCYEKEANEYGPANKPKEEEVNGYGQARKT